MMVNFAFKSESHFTQENNAPLMMVNFALKSKSHFTQENNASFNDGQFCFEK